MRLDEERSMQQDFIVYIRQVSNPPQPIAPLICISARRLARFEGRLLPNLVAALAFESQIRSLSTNSSSYAFSFVYSVSAVVVESCAQFRLPLSAVPLHLLPASLVPQDI